MKRILALILSFYFLSQVGFSQMQVEILAPDDVVQSGDTLKFCKSSFILTVNVTYSDGSEFNSNDATYEWDFGDGILVSGSDFSYSKMEHIYNEAGAYYIKVTVTDEFDEIKSTVRPVFVTKKPYFLETEADIEVICKWDKVNFTGVVLPQTWEYKLPEHREYEEPQLLTDNVAFTSTITYSLFDQGQLLENIDQLASVFIDMEHSDMSSVTIELSCPDKTSVILKNNSGDNSYLGEPVDVEGALLSIGKTYRYSWTLDAEKGTLGEEAGNYVHNYTDTDGQVYTNQSYLPEDNYKPHESLSRLVGCPLNGDWVIKVTDNSPVDNGYIERWGIKFEEEFELPMWKYTHTYSDFDWSGGNISGTTLAGTAFDQRIDGQDEELPPGDYDYVFTVKDDFNCIYDTTLFVTIEKPVIISTSDAGGAGGGVVQAPVTYNFSTECEWGDGFEWNFGDSGFSIEREPIHDYPEGGAPDPIVFKVILKVTSEQGCVDSDTLELSIKAPGHEFERPNVFIPDGAPSNQVFKINITDENELETFDCKIYNRWGKMIYSYTDWREGGWDGKINGADAPEGVYYYFIKYEGKDKEKGKERGFVHLIRKTN